MVEKLPHTSKSRAIVQTAVVAGVSLVPGVGGSIAVILDKALTYSDSKRRDAWLGSLASDLSDLIQQSGGPSLDRLGENPLFSDAVRRTTRIAETTSQEEKILALRNAVLNSVASDSFDADIQLIFLRNLEDFTASHLILLAFFDDPRAYFKQHSLQWPDKDTKIVPSSIVQQAFPNLKNDIYDRLLSHLRAQGLINQTSPTLSAILTPLLETQTTRLGREFLAFITDPRDGRQPS
jgi:hypothetical protein